MTEKPIVTTREEWQALPEVVLPVLRDAGAKGHTYLVHRIGMVEPLRANLPTVTVDAAGQEQLCRLPVQLADWALSCIAFARRGALTFPQQVEFGVLDGRQYAELR